MAGFIGRDTLKFEYMDGDTKTLLTVSANVFQKTENDHPSGFLDGLWHSERKIELYEELEDPTGRKYWAVVDIDEEDTIDILVTRLLHECRDKVERTPKAEYD